MVWTFLCHPSLQITKNESGNGTVIHGVYRVSRGMPNCVHRVIVTKKEELLQSRGIVKASILKGDTTCDGLVAALLYHSNPIYFMSNACESIEWEKKNRRL